MIKLFETKLPEDSIKYVEEVLREGWLSEGVTARLFEEKLQSLLKEFKTFTVNSGTSALHLALILAGVKAGDEVIIPSQTFVATGLAVLYVGAKPVLADVNPKTGEISIESAKNKITEKTKAIIAVDWGGYPCDYKGLSKLAQQYNLKVIRDAAHSIFSSVRNININDYVDFTCYSFQGIKSLTTGDGGAVSCRSVFDFERGKKLRWFGIDRVKDLPDASGERKYNLHEVGYKYHMNNVAAAIGLGQLDTIIENTKNRQQIARGYNAELCCYPGVTVPDYNNERISSYWLYPLLVENRNDFIKHLDSYGVEASVVHQGIDRNNIFGGLDESLVGQRELDKKLVHIPIRPNLTMVDFTRIINIIRMGW